MPLILNEEEGKLLGKKQVIVPKKLVNKLKQNKDLFGKYKKTKGFKRVSAIVDDDYNKRSNRKDKIHTDDKTISFGDLKRIDHDMRHTNPNPHNLEYVLPGGDEMKNWAHDTLRKLRTSVKKVQSVPPVPKLEKEPTTPKDLQKDIKLGNATVRLTESDDWHPYYDSIEENGVYAVLNDFFNRKTDKQQWTPLIQPEMYKKALSEFIKFGKFIHFPTKYIYQWIGIIMNNTAKLRANTILAGHDTFLPMEELEEIVEYHPEYFKNAIDKFGEINKDNYYDILEFIGIYDWMAMPDGSDAWSDFGLKPLEKIISKYNENMAPEQTIVLINKALDCSHMRGDLSSIFIVGGSKTLTSISESIKKNRKIIVNENQLLALKEYHDQTVFNFDKDGNAYFEKNNWEHYVDFLENIGKPGTLPKSNWGKYEINMAIENAKAEIDYQSEDINEGDYKEAFLSLVCDSFIYNNDKEDLFTDYFLELFNDYNEFKEKNNYYDECDTLRSFIERETDVLDDLDNIDSYLTSLGYDEFTEELNNIFKDHFLEYDMEENMIINDRGLVYVERNIKIPKFDSPYFNYVGYRNYYNYLKKMYYDLGYCFSWGEDKGEAYCGNSFGVEGSTEIKLKCWIDPKDINWEETVYRNCYSLREEQEVYISASGAKIEVFDVVLEYGEINGTRVSGKSLMKQPIIIQY